MSPPNNKRQRPRQHQRQHRKNQPPALIAHRGYPGRFPENTLVGFEAAISAGAFFIETDVQLTADAVPVLYHDRTLERLSQRPGAVHDYTAAQLARFRTFDYDKFGYKFAQTPIPLLSRFAAFLAANPKVTAFVELKRISVEQFGRDKVVTAVIRELRPVADQCVIISYSLDTLLSVREHSWDRIGAVVDRWRDRKQVLIRSLKPEYLFCNIATLPTWGRLRYKYGQLVIFETSDASVAMRLAKRGVDFVETDWIAEMHNDMTAALD